MEKLYNVSLDLRTTGVSSGSVVLTSGDESTFRLRISLMDGKIPYVLPVGSMAVLNVKHPNCPAFEAVATVVDAANGIIEHKFSGGEFIMFGVHNARVIVKSGEERLTWQQSFVITVEQGPQVGIQFVPGTGGNNADAMLFIPDKLYATVGNPLELYKSQIFRTKNPENYEVFFNSVYGRNYARKWAFIPAAENVPGVNVTVEVRDSSGTVIASKIVEIAVSPLPVGAAVNTLMMIGDSISAYSPDWKDAIRDMSQTDAGATGDVLTMVGTKGTSPNVSEAVSGATIDNFMSNSAANGFWDTTTGRTNFTAYTERTGITPDIAHVMLGTNDCWTLAQTVNNAAAVEADADKLVQFLQYMRSEWPETRILVGLIPYYGDQDIAEVEKVYSLQYRQQLYDKTVQLFDKLLYDKILAAFPDDSNVYIIPYICTMDREYGYGSQEAAANPYTDQTVTIPVNFLHPQTAGQQQMGRCLVDVWARCVMTGEEEAGNVILTNMLTNPEFDGVTGWNNLQAALYTMTASGGEIVQTGISGQSGGGGAILQTARPYVEGHKVYVRSNSKCSSGDQSYYYSQGIQVGSTVPYFSTTKTTDYVTISGVIKLLAEHVSAPYFGLTSGFSGTPALDGITITRTEPLCIDLTAAFGAGNEPDVTWCDANIPYFTGTTEIEG